MKSILFKYMTAFTSLNDEEKQAIVDDILVEEYKKGMVLLRQGDIPTTCYFVLKGCIRQYSIDEAGKEVTTGFITEEQAVSIYNRHGQNKPSGYTLTCIEDCTLVVGDFNAEEGMFRKHSELETMIRKMVEENLGEIQDEWTAFIASTPTERYKSLLRKRPHLIHRVPQHQLASYLGMTPESLSRIKKRVNISDL
ncbi:Crp/Fnr family transcriptional regulator [Paenibacillus sp. GSMTC-2017]|uniref:Crp/Fnr family transcriptional regulator n=1 Tax=Paenibacillus sp. GSMTC-2017 TaxID=2794350 RepID=UPI0018D6C7D5|nr:Crp/Fnr family transcriptional regulator [Paenibacillus sp. GSMTC-2017]MBH5319471.1 Crp/Fnr family transcriptional regulator [Paenibacillus sp. GSMTC-2017]